MVSLIWEGKVVQGTSHPSPVGGGDLGSLSPEIADNGRCVGNGVAV